MKKQTLLSFLLLTLCSCSGLSQKIDIDRAKAIHKVAIVAIEIQQQKPTDNLKLGALFALKDGKQGDSREMQLMARNISDKLVGQLQKKTGWQVMSMDEMIANPEYKKKVAVDMTGARRVLVADNNSEAIYPQNILDSIAFRKTSVEDRAKLAKALGVDAVAELIVFNNIDQSWMSLGHIMGSGDFAYTGRANLEVYGLNSDEPIWRSQNVDGEKTKSSGTLPANLSKLEKLSQLGEVASISAIQKLIESCPL